ncbi:hypothetical protein HDV04_003908 [Boothiomyces sp. JEL0838]|nr:hypothetical protein HDV04_003908 [Boothiomyces sp. JEL0838]
MSLIHNFKTQAALNRSKILSKLSGLSGLIYLKGNETTNRKWTDTENKFRQESFFFYVTGCIEPDYHFTMDISTGKSTLFIPNYDKDYALWCGEPLSTNQVLSKFGVDSVLTHNDLKSVLANYKQIHVIKKEELDSTYPTTDEHLLTAITEARVIKSDFEVGIMQKACDISAQAHIKLMQTVRPGESDEITLLSLFEYECAKRGGNIQAYNGIVGADTRAATLHHYTSREKIPDDPEALVLVDAGCEVDNYASDITRTYPFGGKYVGKHKTIYEMCLEANKQVINHLKPGVKWEDMHRLAENVILDGLLKAGIVKGDLNELKQNHIAALFFPHGLGHLLGIDVHDCGGYPKGAERIQEPGIRYLRMRRELLSGMVVTVEPGVYFVDAILNDAVANPAINKYLNLNVLEGYRKVGGVRIEDDVLITDDGCRVLSHAVPKEIHEIEALMKK